MTVKTIRQDRTQSLRRISTAIASAFSETIQSIVGRDLKVTPGDTGIVEAEDHLGDLERARAVIRGALAKDFDGKHVLITMPVADAITLAGLMMMTPDDVIGERRTRTELEGEDQEAFGEVGNILCSAVDGVLRDQVSQPVGARMHDHGTIRTGSDPDGLLGEGTLVRFTYTLAIAELPPGELEILVDAATAEVWNGGPVVGDGADPGPSSTAGPARTGATADRGLLRSHLRPGETPFEEIPEAPIRGKLASYVSSPELLDVLRRSCRRVGLEWTRHGHSEIPNPGAHRGQIVLLEVPPAEDRRFDWCRRLKDYDPSISVALVLRHPSRSQVLQGFMARADAIVGWPLTEPLLSRKLETALDARDGTSTPGKPSGDSDGSGEG